MTPNGFKYMLPESFSPSEFDFVIGRGQQVKQHSGNRRMFDNIRAIADDYTAADKPRKSFLLSHLVQQVYVKSPQAGFVKKDPESGRWYAVEDALARTSAAQAVRDCLHNHYKSSRQFKQQRRRQARVCGTSCQVSPPSLCRQISSDESSCISMDNGVVDCPDLFSILASAFANHTAGPDEDPFTPTPLAEEDPFMPIPLPVQSLPITSQNVGCLSGLQDFNSYFSSLSATPMAALIQENELERIFA